MAHEREVLRLPDVAVVHAAEYNHAQDVTDEVRELGLQGDGHGVDTTGDVLPIETNGQETETLVTIGATEHAGEVGGLLVCEAEDGEPGKERENPLGEDLPDEDTTKVDNRRKRLNGESRRRNAYAKKAM